MRCSCMLIFSLCILIDVMKNTSVAASAFKKKLWRLRTSFQPKLIIKHPDGLHANVLRKSQNVNSHVNIPNLNNFTVYSKKTVFLKQNNKKIPFFNPRHGAPPNMSVVPKPQNNKDCWLGFYNIPHPCNKPVKYNGIFWNKIDIANPLMIRRKNITTLRFNGTINLPLKNNKWGARKRYTIKRHYVIRDSNVLGRPHRRYHVRRIANTNTRLLVLLVPRTNNASIGGFSPVNFSIYSQFNGNDSNLRINRSSLWDEIILHKDNVTVSTGSNVTVNGNFSGSAFTESLKSLIDGSNKTSDSLSIGYEKTNSSNDANNKPNQTINNTSIGSLSKNNSNNDIWIWSEEIPINNNDTLSESKFLANIKNQTINNTTIDLLSKNDSNNGIWIWSEEIPVNNNDTLNESNFLANNETILLLTEQTLEFNNETFSGSQDTNTTIISSTETSSLQGLHSDDWIWSDDNIKISTENNLNKNKVLANADIINEDNSINSNSDNDIETPNLNNSSDYWYDFSIADPEAA